MRYLSIVLLFLTFFMSVSAHAQANPADITLSLIPTNPSPGSTFTVQAISYGVDLNQARITWQYGGKTVLTGVGKTSVTLTAPQAGVIGLVSLNASGLGFDPTVATITVQPASVDLVWEAADAYVPPFYKGKALTPPGGLIKVAAIPAINAPKGVSYTWSRNDSALGSASGYGKSSITFKNDILKTNEKVSVTVSGGLFEGENMVRLSLYDPKLILYQNKEGFIDYANGKTAGMTIAGPGAVLHFEPYYFSIPTSIKSDLSVTLTEGSTVIPTQSKLTELAVSRPQKSSQSNLTVAIDTIIYSLQHLQKTFTIQFN